MNFPVSIIKATVADAALLADIAKKTFIQSHGHSAPETDIQNYIGDKYTIETLTEELINPDNLYYLLYYNDVAAGFSKILLNKKETTMPPNSAKLERLYLLKDYHGLQLGKRLFEYNVAIARQNNQKAIWLFVWKENERAVCFYKKMGFVITGSYDFKISATHSNPNYIMFLQLK